MLGKFAIRAVMAAAAVAVLVPQAAFAAGKPVTVRIGDVAPIAPDWPAFVAADKGFFTKEGIDAQTTYVGNVASTVQELAGGAFDVASSTFDTAIRAIEHGAGAVMIGGLVIKYPYSIMSAKNIHTVAELKGKRVILPFPKDLLTITWNRWVKEQGMDPKSIIQIYDGSTPNRFNALITGTAQAALLSQPFDFRAKAEGYHLLLDIGAYAKDYGFLVLLGRPQWLKSHPDAARGYLRAMSEAVDWLYDPANRKEAIAILAKHTKLPQNFAEQTYDYYINGIKPFSRHLAIPPRIIKATLQTLVDIGDVKKGADKPLTNLSYLPKK